MSAISENRPPARTADPRRDLRFGTIISIAFFIVLGGWAAFARLDAAAYAEGVLVVSGQRQAVQHRDGGIVETILVHEGERVKRGQLLIRLVAPEVQATERALSSQAIRLLAQRARLQAEELGYDRLVIPSEFSVFSERHRGEISRAMQHQQTELAARASTLSAQGAALMQRAAQSREQGLGYGEQVKSTREQLRLINSQIDALRPLAAKGFVSQTRMRELERVRAELRGQTGQYTASVAQTHEAVRESNIQRLEAERSFAERTASELREVDDRIGDVMPRLTAAREQLTRTEIRAPATGAVVGLSVFTPGGVVLAGQKLMDIIPENTPLMIQVKFSPNDADDLKNGQSVRIKFTGLHGKDVPEISGKLERLSADSLLDDKTGISFFSGEVAVIPSQVKIMKAYFGKSFKLRAGMPAQVIIPLRKRTALDYLLEPIIGSFWKSFREH